MWPGWVGIRRTVSSYPEQRLVAAPAMPAAANSEDIERSAVNLDVASSRVAGLESRDPGAVQEDSGHRQLGLENHQVSCCADDESCLR